ncbi:retropepsin-like aspartic protease [Clostridium sp. ZBS12]|uniref:retropepsin-like aspartic protease n=1 Tax=Clostridium sp. ZBS12 TaxID=2949972 RepID=UPI00207A8ACE|nr:retropepsin-like aspartic protease [Clostridium sp. ZBS12]
MVNLKYMYGLPFCSISLVYKNKEMKLDNVLVDTGSGGTLLKMDKVEEIGVIIEEDDTIETIEGVGGIEFVYKKNIDELIIADIRVKNFKVEIGVMDYGFDIDGIIGIDFLKKINALIDLDKMEIQARNNNG